MKSGGKLLFSQKKPQKNYARFWEWMVWKSKMLILKLQTANQLLPSTELISQLHIDEEFCVFSVRGVLCRSDVLLSSTRGKSYHWLNNCRNVPNLWHISLALHQRVNLSYYYYFCARDHWTKLKSTFHIYIIYMF